MLHIKFVLLKNNLNALWCRLDSPNEKLDLTIGLIADSEGMLSYDAICVFFILIIIFCERDENMPLKPM